MKTQRFIKSFLIISTFVFFGIIYFVKYYDHKRFQLSERPKSYVIISSEHTYHYLFYMPIIQLVWFYRYNISSILVTVGEMKEWNTSPVLKVVSKWNKIFASGTKSINIHAPSKNNQASSLSQIIRIFMPSWSIIKQDDFIYLSDVDLMPLNLNLLKRNGKDILITNAACCGNQHFNGITSAHIPICHVGMTAHDWRNVMGYSNKKMGTITDIVNLTITTIEKEFHVGALENNSHPAEGGDNTQWAMDQTYLSYRLAISQVDNRTFKEYFQIQPRIDRISWPSEFSKEFITNARDSHMPRYKSFQDWTRVRPLFEATLSENIMKSVDLFQSEFENARLLSDSK